MGEGTGERHVMAHTEILVGRVTRQVVCQLCSEMIEPGEFAVYCQVPPKGSAHPQCWHAQRRERP